MLVQRISFLQKRGSKDTQVAASNILSPTPNPTKIPAKTKEKGTIQGSLGNQPDRQLNAHKLAGISSYLELILGEKMAKFNKE